MAPLIAVEEVGKTFESGAHGVRALDRVSFDVEEGSFVSLVGPSGCGKSTLLKIISGLIAASEGIIRVGGRVVDGPLANVGMVFQAPVLLKWRTVVENVMLPVEFAGLDPLEYAGKAHSLLVLVGLEDFEDEPPYQLSGGMQQRVSLCRALVTDPHMLLMDEPFGALDAMTREDLDVELLRIWGEKKMTVVFVTHNIQEAVLLSDVVVVMSPRPGRVIERIPIRLARPRSIEMMSTAEFGRYTLEIRSLLGRAGPNASPRISASAM
ncbi:MAG TPA: ABC transporter ATP-binding protein [Candidatus Binatia bacterium]|nr:ABC transporter ATP-binding protein [Candidatus Binatia bacterium]